MHAAAPTALLCLLAAPAAAQSFNVDFGEAANGPSASYAAAGIAGHWNSTRCEHTTPAPGPQAVDLFLVDVLGQPTAVRLHQFGGTEHLTAADPSVSGDDAALMNDALVTHSVPVMTCLYFNGLERGTYEVLHYAWMPDHPAVRHRVFIDNTPGDDLVGGAWPGEHQVGVTYARHIVQVTTGFMGPHAGLPAGGDPVVGGALNGVQLRKVSCVDCTAYCFGDGAGAPCPCGNAGFRGRGCENSTASGGGRLLASGTARLSADTVQLRVEGVPASTQVLFFQGTGQENGGFGTPLGDGLLCVAGTLVRLGIRQASGGVAELGSGSGGVPPLSVAGGVGFAGARTYQAWYRNAASYCTSATSNQTNAMLVPWTP